MLNIDNISKGRVLLKLDQKLKRSEIPKLKIFTVKEWKTNKTKILKEIKKYFKKNTLIIRSSKSDEDSSQFSQAGMYHSELNVKSENKNLTDAINKVIKSYGNKDILTEEFMVQKMINTTSMSGVVFTHDPDTFAPYYIINYDDISEKTSTVTSGSTEHSNKTLSIYRKTEKNIRSDRFKKLVEAIREIEGYLNNSFLDIEFGINKNLKVFIFQVRKITNLKKWNKEKITKFRRKLELVEYRLLINLNKKQKIHGTKNVLGQMPDWNPAEIIGRCPTPLAYSLYKKLITNKSWAKAREIMGYKKLEDKNLMLSLGGQPYIDTRLSFNSFLPSGLPKTTSVKLVNSWIKNLINEPNNHDKIEFNVATTCFNFNFKNQVKNLNKKILNKDELLTFKSFHKKQFISFFDKGVKSQKIENTIKKIELLKLKQKQYTNKTKLSDLILDCINLGVIPFSILARHAFIAKSILLSLKEIKLINTNDVETILNSVKTVASDFLEDLDLYKRNKISKKIFFNKYGHLRPGTYDINSANYKNANYINLKNFQRSQVKYTEKILISKNKIKRIDKLIKKEDLKNLNFYKLIDYIKKSLSMREYSKFIFTKNIDLIFSYIEQQGLKHKLSKNDLSFLDINFFLKKHKKTVKETKKTINNKKNEFILTKAIKLPQIIHDSAGAFIAPYQVNLPNFVTKKKVICESLFLKKKFKNIKINNKIIFIESADPGYDWLFTYKIKGLVTKFGGVNSHMAIRCRELNIPAAIGCGEKLFSDLMNSKKIILDCSINKIDRIK